MCRGHARERIIWRRTGDALGGHDVATVGIALLLIKGMLLQYDMPVVEKVGEVDSGGQVVGGDQKFLV